MFFDSLHHSFSFSFVLQKSGLSRLTPGLPLSVFKLNAFQILSLIESKVWNVVSVKRSKSVEME